MKAGTEVTWQIVGAPSRGRGTVVLDLADGHVLVAAQTMGWPGEVSMGFEHVIRCPVDWLKTSEPVAATPPPASDAKPAEA